MAFAIQKGRLLWGLGGDAQSALVRPAATGVYESATGPCSLDEAVTVAERVVGYKSRPRSAALAAAAPAALQRKTR